MASTAAVQDGWMARAALRSAAWAEKWFPDAYVFAVLGVVIVALAAMGFGSTPQATASAFGDGFWSLIPFTMQMAFVVIGGYAVATAPVVARFIDFLARVPRTGRGAVLYVGLVSMLASLLSWGFSLVFGGLLVRALARRTELRMDYRAAGASAYLGLGAVWAMGLSSSAAQLQANPASMPPGLVEITGVLPFTETIFLWQSIALTSVLILVSLLIAWLTAPAAGSARTAEEFPGAAQAEPQPLQRRTRPGEWLEYSPLLTVLLSLLAFGWLFNEFANKPVITAIANLNTYNFLFISLGLLLHWRPRSFLNAVAKAVPSTTGVLIQFPLYGGIAMILTHAAGGDGQTLAHRLSSLFVHVASTDSFALVMGVYSAVLGFFVPSGGGKWIIEAPYVMQAANELKAHLGWAVQVYNAAEALPNLINPFWMLPLLGVLGLKARDIVGFTFIQLLVHIPLVLGLLWLLGMTLAYVPPVMP
ncbi:short-chain fatty acid transporter [Stenotrophomonas maltophilia]|uniref:short-chain fatty acid transporter n=1 Tax=Stenotrophomonas TaxID=40323 RepID=UPI0009B2A346|nr:MULTISPECIES: TIGR00366 family protein [unclassified Stenotrophomonas]MBA0255564.1 short-chain fatty acid transporter [Stenotrophomonas maltophilia]MBA0378599.1 short-chain fatty acid transporter [Stenotrophomonas maltophilia]MBA0407402.1 short-chain fatty acid transporter [Stenotrophomonas maltophilia]MBA0424703.1 short-chain fatty acid transporter [Stenotrophomonas maltophilia]MBA0453869.1 short-chain fatty acid transporter [Stenotrophomonas maltophilia]